MSIHIVLTDMSAIRGLLSTSIGTRLMRSIADISVLCVCRAFLEPLGNILEGSWGPLGGLLGAFVGLLGASWEPPGVSWTPLGGLLGASWGHLERSAGVLFAKAKRGDVSFRLRCDLEPSWGRLGTSWGRLGAILGRSGSHLRPSGGHCGRS